MTGQGQFFVWFQQFFGIPFGHAVLLIGGSLFVVYVVGAAIMLWFAKRYIR